MLEDDPKPQGVHEMWLLSLGMEEPYNNAHEIGLAVREVEDSEEGDEKPYVRVGIFQFFMRGNKARNQDTPMRRLTII